MPKIVNFFESDSEDGLNPVNLGKSEIMEQRKQLPMYQGRHEVVGYINSNKVTIVIGETGSGKSTQLPQALLESNKHERIVVSQPRRVAAISLAQRVSQEMNTQLGQKVGYNVRFDSKISNKTKIRYVTDGMLLREFMLDRELQRYTTVIVDEAHERTVTTDIILGLLNQLISKRRNLKIVVMSATLDANKFKQFFESTGSAVDVPMLYIPGRAFEVERFYSRKPVANYIDAAVETVLKVNRGEPSGGDILVFLPGQDDIEAAAELLRDVKQEKGVPKLVIVPLYASLSEAKQQLAFQPVKNTQRKAILATNIAETSVTIPGVRYVVDSGLRKVRIHRTKLGLESLLPAPISQASASQRMGRAGRERDGKCWRLYTENTYREKMVPQTEPEISRISLTASVLMLKTIGVKDPQSFAWVDSPSGIAIRNAMLHLYSIKALDKSGDITLLGRKMATLPLDPSLAAVLLNAYSQPDLKIREACLDVAACLSVPDFLLTPPAARREEVNEKRQELFPAAIQYGDLVLVKLVWDAAQKISKYELKEWCHSIGVNMRALRKVEQVKQQLRGYIEVSQSSVKDEDSGMDSDSDDDSDAMNTEFFEQLIKLFLRGFVHNTAIALPDKRYQTTVNQQPISIHPGSSMFGQKPDAILYLEYVYTLRGYARLVSPVEVDWLKETAPHLLARASNTEQ